MMNYTLYFVVFAIVLAGEYLLSRYSYIARGCRLETRIGGGLIDGLTAIGEMIVAILLVKNVYSPVRDSLARVGMSIGDTRLAAVACTVMACACYKLVVMSLRCNGEERSYARARAAALEQVERCRQACEEAGVGDTVLTCCANLNCPECPLGDTYEVRLKMDVFDILYTMRAEERQQRSSQVRSKNAGRYSFGIPMDRVVKKPVLDPGPAPITVTKAEAMERKIIPFADSADKTVVNGTPQASREDTYQPPIKLDPLITAEEAKEVASRRMPLAKLKTVACSAATFGVKVKDCGQSIQVAIIWINTKGRKCIKRWSLEKDSASLLEAEDAEVIQDTSYARSSQESNLEPKQVVES